MPAITSNTHVNFRHRPWLKALKRIRSQRSIVLGYHGVAASRLRDDLSLLQVPPARFRTQIELLLAAGFRFVTMAELAQRADGTTPEPGLAAVTFDDGMRNNRTVAMPILDDYNIPATVYVTIGFIEGISPWIGANGDGAMMDEAELRELSSAGWELGAHTMTHPDMTALDYEACRVEIDRSVDELERISETAVRTFAYPSGRYNAETIRAVSDAGLLAAVTTGSGSWERFEITRAMIGAIDPWPVILLKLTDRYEPLMRSAPVKLLRQTSKRVRGWLQGH